MTVTNLRSPAMVNRLVYNTGRILTYALMGAVVSSIGMALPISKFQNALSILLGVFLLMMGIIGTTGVRIPLLTKAINSFTSFIKEKFSVLIKRKNSRSMLLMGALNGLLPCGLTYIALAFCVTLPVPANGFLYMTIFGVGTLPVMLGFTSILSLLAKRVNINAISRSLLILSGILLIVRVFVFHTTEGHEAHQSITEIIICR
jgi:sulfite exporter TauE/SafE